MAREQAWVDAPAQDRRLIVLSANPISHALRELAGIVGVRVHLIESDENGLGRSAIRQLGPGAHDAVLVCDHDAPDANDVLRDAIRSGTGYVAMLASRTRTERTLAALRTEGFTDAELEHAHLPAGLNIGGRRPGEIALSVLAEVVATWNERPGGPMRHPTAGARPGGEPADGTSATAPPTPEPDTKDWTWSITRPCPDCGFDAAAVPVDQIAPATLAVTDRLVATLDRPDAATRPAPQTWSTLEYVAHVRDVCTVFGERARLMRDQEDPQFADWDQDGTALEQRYWELQLGPLAEQTRAAATGAAAVFAAVGPDQWERPGRRSNGSQFTIATLGRYFLHDLHHHAWDVGA